MLRVGGMRWVFGLLAIASATGCSTVSEPAQVQPPWQAERGAPRSFEAAPGTPVDVATTSPDRPAIYGPSYQASAPPRLRTLPPLPSTQSLRIDNRPPVFAAPAATPRRGGESLPPPAPLLATTREPGAFGSPVAVAGVPAPVGPDGYVIGVGDTVTVTVFGQPDLTVTTNVSDDGSVPMALIGKTPISG